MTLYDIPIRAGRRIETKTMLRLAREVPNIVALKAVNAHRWQGMHLKANRLGVFHETAQWRIEGAKLARLANDRG